MKIEENTFVITNPSAFANNQYKIYGSVFLLLFGKGHIFDNRLVDS